MDSAKQTHALISIIVPVYNAENTLRRCIDSILAQSYAPIEIILVDDGSTDSSPAIADTYASGHKEKVRVIHKENGGLMHAWLDGVQSCSGQYLCFVDSDDWVDAEMIRQMAAQLTRLADGSFAPGQIVCCGYLIEYPNGQAKPVSHGLPDGIYEGDRLLHELKEDLLGHEERRVIPSRCMKLISRELFTQNFSYLDFSIHMAEDLNITIPAILDASRIVLMHEPFYHYAFIPGSMIHRYDESLYDNYDRLRRQLRSAVSDKLGPAATAIVDREFLFLFFNILKNEVRRNDRPHAFRKATDKIRTYCAAEDSRKLLAEHPEKIRQTTNRLLSILCIKQSLPRILLVRSIFRLYELLR